MSTRLKVNRIISSEFITKIFLQRESSVLLLLVGLILLFGLITPRHAFLNRECWNIILRVTPELGITAIGVTVLMICGEFDLSVGSILCFSSIVAAKLVSYGVNAFMAMTIVLALGASIGALNGVIVTKFHIPSFLVTLGTMMIWRGMVLLASKGFAVYFSPDEKCPIFAQMLGGTIKGIVPITVIWFLVVVLILWILTRYHKFGNWIYAVGGNKEATKLMGVNTDRVRIICFTIVGFLSSFSGIIQITRIKSAYPTQGIGMELQAITASVLGGTSLAGGSGNVVGSFIGAFIVQVINTGLVVMRAPAFWFQTFVGTLLIVVVIINRVIGKKMRRV